MCQQSALSTTFCHSPPSQRIRQVAVGSQSRSQLPVHERAQSAPGSQWAEQPSPTHRRLQFAPPAHWKLVLSAATTSHEASAHSRLQLRPHVPRQSLPAQSSSHELLSGLQPSTLTKPPQKSPLGHRHVPPLQMQFASVQAVSGPSGSGAGPKPASFDPAGSVPAPLQAATKRATVPKPKTTTPRHMSRF